MAATLAFLSTVGLWNDILAKPEPAYDDGSARSKLLDPLCETKVRIRKYSLDSGCIKAYMAH